MDEWQPARFGIKPSSTSRYEVDEFCLKAKPTLAHGATSNVSLLAVQCWSGIG